MKSSTGKNVKKSRKEAALKNLKKGNKKRKVDWLRLEKYRTNRLSGMNRYQAARAAGWAESTARHNSSKLDRLAKIGIIEALEDAGATNKIMARELVRIATSAMKRQRCTVEVRQEDGELVIDDSAAELVPDEHLRQNTWELIGKFKKQLGTHILPNITDYDRLVIVVERNTKDHAGKENSSNTEADSRLRLVDQP